MKVVVLGAGLVGGPIAMDLARESGCSVKAVDRDAAALKRLSRHGIETMGADLSRPQAVAQAVAGCDFVISAVPGFMGFATLQAVIAAGKNVVDIAFFPEDARPLDAAAKAAGVVAVVDSGVAPGMSHLLSGHAVSLLDRADSVLILVGGLPQVRHWPYEYRAVFSPIDVIEEYTRPARYVESGRVVTRPALSDPELVDLPGVGTLEAFNTDGLRSLMYTLQVPDMKEKTLRYPGHIEKIGLLAATGLFSTEEIEVNGAKVRPIDVTSKLLFPLWQLQPGEEDLTVMRIVVRGTKRGQETEHRFDLLDRYDKATDVHSMARTTGYAATAMLRLIAAGLYRKPGLSFPEFVGGDPACVDFILEDLSTRGVVYRHTVTEKPGRG